MYAGLLVEGRQIAPEVFYLARDGYLVESSLMMRKANKPSRAEGAEGEENS